MPIDFLALAAMALCVANIFYFSDGLIFQLMKFKEVSQLITGSTETLTFRTFSKLFMVVYSPAGTNKKRAELHSYEVFLKYCREAQGKIFLNSAFLKGFFMKKNI